MDAAAGNALGEPNDTIFWGIKNYVEGGNYLGVATWLLAAVAVGYAVQSLSFGPRNLTRDGEMQQNPTLASPLGREPWSARSSAPPPSSRGDVAASLIRPC